MEKEGMFSNFFTVAGVILKPTQKGYYYKKEKLQIHLTHEYESIDFKQNIN